jgi:hypothetical protein
MVEKKRDPKLDKFTRTYLYVLAGLVLVGFLWWLSGLNFRVGEINEQLEADAILATYPYPFHVLSLNTGVAEVSSPRSAEMSAVQSLRIMYPSLQHSSAVSDEMIAAQEELARVQSHAGDLVKSQPDVHSVRWVLDKRWLENHGVLVE